jgi:hypothetical protein
MWLLPPGSKGFAVALLYFGFCMTSAAEASETLSFTPFKVCKKPPKAPPAKLLKKTYRTYIDVGDWSIFDINGDGWCDWVRNGNEGHRTDQEEPPIRELIYLGTSKGWRYSEQSEVYKAMRKLNGIGVDNGYMPGYLPAFNFYQPIVIYTSTQEKPYIAVVGRDDAPAPPSNREDINVLQWDDRFDKLRYVSDESWTMVVDFLQRELCKNPPALLDETHSPLMMAQGDLCSAKSTKATLNK